jgi:serine/threonine-protein kinase
MGQTLEAVLARSDERQEGMPPPVAVAITLRILDALAYAHALTSPSGEPLNLVHRDLSPGNIMVGYDGQVKLIDFGVAQVRIDSFRTAPGMMVGTLRYMSPEQAATAEVDHRSDLYTVGAVLFEMLTGRSLVPKGKALEVLQTILDAPLPPLRRAGADFPEALEAVVHRSLAKAPEDRWPHAGAFRDALRAAAAPLGRANRTHLGLLVSQLFPDEELAAQRWHEIETPPTPFGAHDTEDGRGTLTTRPETGPDAEPSALPPLTSSSAAASAPEEGRDLVTTRRSPPRAPREDRTLPDPADFGLTPEDLHEDDEPTRAGAPEPPRARRDVAAEPGADGARAQRALELAKAPSRPPGDLDGRIERLERRVLLLEIAALGFAVFAVVMAALAAFA